MANTEHKGTDVRWSAAFTLCKTLKIKTKHNNDLKSVAENSFSNKEKK